MIGKERLERLETAHGKQYIKLTEVECKLMRTDARIKVCLDRGFDADALKDLRDRYIVKRSEILMDLAVTRGAIADVKVEFGLEAPLVVVATPIGIQGRFDI